MGTYIPILVSSAIAFVVGWLLSGLKSKTLDAKLSARDSLDAELRAQIGKKESELSELRKGLEQERDIRARAETRYEDAERGIKEQRESLEIVEKKLTDAFSSLASSALKSSNEDFLRLASERLGIILAETKGKLSEHSLALDSLLKPIGESLSKYDEGLRAMELKREQDYSSLGEQIKNLASTHSELQRQTGNLVTALRKPHVRGAWGEITLRNVVELAGMSGHCDFQEQVSVDSESGRLRPDMIIKLPGQRQIVVDSKVSLDAMLDAASADSEEAKKDSIKKHARHVKEQIDRLSRKEYWKQFERAPELAVLFISEASLVYALEAEPKLFEESMSKRVLVATPTTLFALLSAVAYGWRQEKIAKNAEDIASSGKELYERMRVLYDHMKKIGGGLMQAVNSYNMAVGSIESRVMPSVRRLKDLGASSSEDVPELKEIENTPRNLNLME